MSAGDLNQVFSTMRDNLSANTVQQRQASARVFYRYHKDELGVDPDAIFIVKNEPSPVDPRDLFDRDEIDAMRNVIDNPRDRAFFDLALYTGQRIRAITTLRVRDIDLDESRFYLNPDAYGLKGAKGMRSLLIAKGGVAEWMDYHPDSDNPDAHFITKLPDAARGDSSQPLHQTTINRRIKKIAKEAGIDRPEERGHAHNLRHTFVRWAYIHKEMDLATIKWMMGHSKDSQTLEETYFNILDRDHAQKAEEAAGVAEPDEEVDITPDSCPVCDYALPAQAKACPRCGSVLTPDAAGAQEQIQATVKESYKQTNPEDKETQDKIDVLDELLDDPDVKAALLEKLNE